MEEKEIIRTFSESVREKFTDLGLPKSTTSKIFKIFSKGVVNKLSNKVIITSSDTFYTEQIILPEIKIIYEIFHKYFHNEYKLIFINKKNEFLQKIEKNKSDHVNKNIVNTNKIEKETVIPKTEQSQKEKMLSADQEKEKNNQENYSFYSFIPYSEAIIALKASQSICTLETHHLSNPLYIYSETGMGKTHLLHSIKHQIISLFPHLNIIYTTSNNFINEIIHKGIKGGKMEDIRKKYTSCDFFLFDDVQFLENKDACQKEFFHIFNELLNNKKQIVISSDTFPKELRKFEEKLKSRFLQGIVVNIPNPSYKEMKLIINEKCKLYNVKLTENSIDILANKESTSIREIEGFIKEICFLFPNNEKLNEISILNTIKKRFPEKILPKEININKLQRIICNYFQIEHNDLLGKNREKKNVHARHIAMFISKETLNLPVSSIGKSFSNRDHTTVLHAINKIKLSIKNDPGLKSDISKIQHKLIARTETVNTGKKNQEKTAYLPEAAL